MDWNEAFIHKGIKSNRRSESQEVPILISCWKKRGLREGYWVRGQPRRIPRREEIALAAWTANKLRAKKRVYFVAIWCP